MIGRISELGRETLNIHGKRTTSTDIAGEPAEKSAAVEEDDRGYCGSRAGDSHSVLCVSALQAAWH